jgi:hypothetical protein
LLLATETSARFAVYDLLEAGPPRNFIEAAERGDDNYIIKVIERTIDFNINQTVGANTRAQLAEAWHLAATASVLQHLAAKT